MAIRTLQATQNVRTTLAQAWSFFSNPRNLARITPEHLGFDILTLDLPEAIYPGLMIAYRVRPILGIPMTWLTEITQVDEGRRFIDEQRIGPYAVWHHEHTFRDLGGGQVELGDRVTYALPFGPLGDLLHGWLVRPQLDGIFAHRERAIREIFGP